MKFIKTGYLLLFADYDKIKVGEREKSDEIREGGECAKNDKEKI